MNQESSQTEVANTTGSTSESIQKESTKLDVETAPKVATTLTRTKSETVESLSEPSEPVDKITESSSDPTPGELVGLGLPPYITDLLDAHMAYETFDVKEALGEIDEYIRESIDDSRTSYEKVFNALIAQIGEQESVYTSIDRLKEYIQLQKKIRGILKEKEDFEAKKPEDMTTKELERYFNGKK
jgi:hypothetical protein